MLLFALRRVVRLVVRCFLFWVCVVVCGCAKLWIVVRGRVVYVSFSHSVLSPPKADGGRCKIVCAPIAIAASGSAVRDHTPSTHPPNQGVQRAREALVITENWGTHSII